MEPNLYIVKTMNQEGVWFKSGKQNLQGSYLEKRSRPEFLEALKEKLTELFETPYFKMQRWRTILRYSIYKTLFGKGYMGVLKEPRLCVLQNLYSAVLEFAFRSS